MLMMTGLNLFKFVLLSLSLLHLSNVSFALYEDQIKKFDWRKLNVGRLKHASFENTFEDRVLVGTDENVLAALSTKTGEILWRQVFEKGPRGDIKLLYVQQDRKGVVHSQTANRLQHDVLTVSGHAPALVRGWSFSGALQWEWSLMLIQTERSESALWFADDIYLYQIIPVDSSHLEVTKYYSSTGQPSETTAKISVQWASQEKCVFSAPYYVCIDGGNQLLYLDLSAEQPHVLKKILATHQETAPVVLNGGNNLILVGGTVVSLKNEDLCSIKAQLGDLDGKYNERPLLISLNLENENLLIKWTYIDKCEEISSLEAVVEYPKYYGLPHITDYICRTRNHGERSTECSVLLKTDDGAIMLIKQSKIKWVREESLANIAAAEFIDLPLSDAEGAIENELNSKPEELKKHWDVIGAFSRRISSQILHLRNTLLHVFGLGLPPTASQKAGLIRDAFGLHKIIVVLTESGKFFGIDNLTGKQHWVQYLDIATNFGNDQKMKLYTLRTSKHFPHLPVCALVAKNKQNGNGLIYTFNPITGQPVDEGLNYLSYEIKQLSLLRESEDDFFKGLLIIDRMNKPHVIPDRVQELANGMYIFTADKIKSSLSGFYIQYSQNKLDAIPIWEIHLATQAHNHKITAIGAKNPIEHVHSQGRVLSDRSVLYKYINPNLVAIVTQGPDSIHRHVMNVHLIDVVSGSIVFSMTHKKVKGPIHMVHSENWLVYSYYNDKVRRTEITTVELYEGKIQANGTVWSSLDAPPIPLIERQSYIFPATIEAMRETITEKGITNKHVLIGISNGGILEMPWSLLDPRRPVSTPNQIREEGAIPYIPELPIPTENIINYNQSIARIDQIYTAPSGLESTCLVFGHGLDIFVTRVSPSKTFDLLKEDFDYFLITVVLIALTTGSFIAKHLSSRKALKQAWK